MNTDNLSEYAAYVADLLASPDCNFTVYYPRAGAVWKNSRGFETYEQAAAFYKTLSLTRIDRAGTTLWRWNRDFPLPLPV